MKSDELLAYFRAQVNDRVQPYFASDDDCYVWMTDARRELCRRTLGIPDAQTDEICTYLVKAGTVWTKVDDRILQFIDAYWTDQNGMDRKILFGNQENMLGYVRYDYGQRVSYGWSQTPGEPTYAIIGEQDGFIKWNPPFQSDYTVHLTVYRECLNDITGDGQDLEVAPRHHINLADWMMFRYYSRQDAEAYDKGKAVEFEARFVSYCQRIKEEQERAKAKPRVVVYGGL